MHGECMEREPIIIIVYYAKMVADTNNVGYIKYKGLWGSAKTQRGPGAGSQLRVF